MPAPPTTPGLKKSHLPAVGIIGLALIGVAMASVYYTQFVAPPSTTCTVAPIHRIYIMSAVIQDIQGFKVEAIYSTNLTTSIPVNSSGVPNVASANFTKLPARADPREVYGSIGDTITIYIRANNTTDSRQYNPIPGHGFEFTDKSFLQSLNVTGGTPASPPQPTPVVLTFGKWVTITFKVAAQATAGFFCTVVCSSEHQNMKGSLKAGCGG